MGEFLTAKSFLVWLTSAAGLGVAVTFLMAGIKKYVDLDGWQAFGMVVFLAIVLGGGATLLIEYKMFQYIEEYWGLIIAILSVIAGGGVALGSSQLVYHKAPKTGEK